MTQERLAEYKKEQARQRKERLRESSKNRLTGSLRKRIQTTFIGSISSLEENFGFIWGKGKKWEDKTEDERYFSDLWAETRAEILKRGNGQIRALERELSEYDIDFVGQKIELKPRRKDGQGEEE